MKEYQWNKQLNPQMELTEIKRVRKLQIRKRYRRTKIDDYRGELSTLYNAGGSFGDMVVWLRRRKKVTVSRSTVHRIMSKWPEVMIRRQNDA